MAVGESARSSGAGSGSVVRRVRRVRRRCNSITSQERSGTQSPLTKAFVDRFGIVKNANTTATSNQPGQLPGPQLLSDNLVLTAYGQFDFNRFKLPDGQTGLFEAAPAASPYLIRGRTDLIPLEAGKDLSSPACRTKIAEAQVGSMTQKDLVLSGLLPDYYLAGSDYNANANRYAKQAFLSDLKAECARNARCDAKKTESLIKLGSAALDFVPVIGDIKAFVEAETPFDYLLATVGIAGPVGDSFAKALREGRALYKAGDIAGASGKLDEAKTIIVDSKGNALIGDWTHTKTLTSPENAQAHWTKHASEFPQYSNAAQYVEGAQAFVTNPPAGTLKLTRPNGDTVLFDPLTDTFAIKTSSGAPRTMFKPDPAKHGYPTNLDYFNAQK